MCFTVRFERGRVGIWRRDTGSLFQAEGPSFTVRFERGRVGLWRGDTGSLFQAEGPKTEKDRDPTVDCLDRRLDQSVLHIYI